MARIVVEQIHQHDTLVTVNGVEYTIVKHGLLCYKIRRESTGTLIDWSFKSFRKALKYLAEEF